MKTIADYVKQETALQEARKRIEDERAKLQVEAAAQFADHQPGDRVEIPASHGAYMDGRIGKLCLIGTVHAVIHYEGWRRDQPCIAITYEGTVCRADGSPGLKPHSWTEYIEA